MDLQENIDRSSTCPICLSLFRQVTTIEGCCHQFCHNCITKKITEEDLHSCPVCNADIGSDPLQKLRVDQSCGQSTMKRKANEESPCVQENDSQVSKNPESSNELIITHKDDADQTKKRFTMNEKQKYIAEGSSSNSNDPKSTCEQERGKSLGKMSDLFGPQMGSENAAAISEQAPKKDVAFTSSSKLQQSGEQAWNKSLQEKVASVIASSGSKNPSATVTVDDKNAKHDKKRGAFWFALVASDKQKCRAPLEQIPSRYLRVKDGNITVSSIKKYLMQKFNLSSENEVEISLQGRVLRPNVQIYKLLELWLHTTTPSETKRAYVGCSAKDFVLTLTYGRKAN